MTGPQGTGKTIFVQIIVNASIELETIPTPTNNNNEDDSMQMNMDVFLPKKEMDNKKRLLFL